MISRVELALDPADLGLPVRVGRIELADLADAVHEPRELLELGPLVVGGAHGHADVNGLGHGTHDAILLVGCSYPA